MTEYGVGYMGAPPLRTFPDRGAAVQKLGELKRANALWKARRDDEWESPLIFERQVTDWVAESGS